jgi:probable rRNA maturation factor
MLKIVAIDAQGKRRKLDAERLEVELPGGRRLTLDAPHLAWGDLDMLAESDAGTPMLNLQPAGCNLVTIRVVAHHDATAASPTLGLEVQRALNGDDKLLARPRKPQIRTWAGAALERDAEITVRLVGEEEGRALNRDFRGKDYPTNVLTFTYDDGEPATSSAPLLGDLVLCVPVVVREALEQGKSPEAHYAHLVVHGMLHLQGYDHEDETDAERMEARERAVLASLGYSDPYAE